MLEKMMATKVATTKMTTTTTTTTGRSNDLTAVLICLRTPLNTFYLDFYGSATMGKYNLAFREGFKNLKLFYDFELAKVVCVVVVIK
mmetsp:Transcript_13454/g.28204  ORF Transcript_13454/g.28204 Transcript_13454/m.28204 type:complete len:87 (+) Transcript_13454:1150-1410(+)